MVPEIDDDARRRVAAAEVTAEAVDLMSADAYNEIDFSQLVALKKLLKTYFSAEPWGEDHEKRLAAVLPDVADTWEHRLGNGALLQHGLIDGQYRIRVTGGSEGAEESTGLFDRLFSGPIVPEATPNPRHIRFPLGGRPGESVFYDGPSADISDKRVVALFEDPDVADVLIAPDFVAIGLDRADKWESRIDDILLRVADLFDVKGAVQPMETPTRDELVSAATTRSDVHLLDPDSDDGRQSLLNELASDEARRRRLALATMGNTADPIFLAGLLERHWEDESRIVRRTAVDVAVDHADEPLRALLERALADADAWIRWKAMRGLFEIGAEASRPIIESLEEDPDFRVRLEVARALRDRKLQSMRIEVAATPESASEQAALAIADALIGSAQNPVFGLAGGSTPRLAYERLAKLDVDWSRVIGFLGDERWVPSDHADSNFGMVGQTALGATGMKVLEVPYGDDPQAAAAAYAAELAHHGTPSVLLLGIGDDGHTASLFPGTDGLDASGDYVANWVGEKDTWRLTVTFDFISRVDHVMFLVTGSAKAQRLAEIMDPNCELPAARAARAARQVTWFLDEAAAAEI